MNIEKILASIPTLTMDARKAMRENANAKAASEDPRWTVVAQKILAALDAQEASDKSTRTRLRTRQIAELENSTPVERIVAAFQLEPPTLTETALIKLLLDHPGSSCEQLSIKMGWDPIAWDMQFGKLCAKRASLLAPHEPRQTFTAEGYIQLLTTQVRDDVGSTRYKLKPEATTAFGLLGFRPVGAT